MPKENKLSDLQKWSNAVLTKLEDYLGTPAIIDVKMNEGNMVLWTMFSPFETSIFFNQREWLESIVSWLKINKMGYHIGFNRVTGEIWIADETAIEE